MSSDFSPQFDLYKSPDFKDTLSKIYKFSTLEIDGVRFFKKIGFPAKSELFHSPFGFFDSQMLSQSEWCNLEDYSKKTSINIRYQSLLNVNYTANRAIVSNCPILKLPNSPEDIRSGYSLNLRSNLKKLENKINAESIKLEKAKTMEDLDFFYYKVLAPEYVKKHRMVFQPIKLFRRILFDLSVGELYLAKKGCEILGGILITKDTNVMHYNWGAFPKYKNLPIGLALINHTITEAIKEGFEYYDLGATSLSDSDLLDFKLRFGALNLPIYEYFTLKESASIDLNKDLALSRKLFSYLPPEVAARLMPYVVPMVIR